MLSIAFPNCGGMLHSPAGHILSPGFPHSPTREHTLCSWTVSAPRGRRLRVALQEINLNENCHENSVTISGLADSDVTLCGIDVIANDSISSRANISVVYRSKHAGEVRDSDFV